MELSHLETLPLASSFVFLQMVLIQAIYVYPSHRNAHSRHISFAELPPPSSLVGSLECRSI